LVGVLALLNQADILTWGRSWPLYLILAGVLLLAERAALASEGGVPTAPYPGVPYPGAPYTGPVDPAAAQGQPGASIVPAHPQDYGKDSEGGQS
jgi:hypothetical protein